MKRIKAACLEQTVHFQLKDDLGHAAAARAVKEEYEHYKMQLERSRTRYKIVEETVQPDDSILIKIKKQYNHHDYGDYMDCAIRRRIRPPGKAELDKAIF